MTTVAPHQAAPSPPVRGRQLPPVGALLLAVVAYVPLLLTQPGQVGADTKTYLYLDPSRLLSRAAWMWDTNIGLGTVTHQNIGYLWPMGPYYWLMDAIGLPDWVAQRLWLGSIIFAAGMGVRFMLRELKWVGPGLTVAAFAYALSPYLLHYGARISVILLPFAGLPWLIGIASRSLRVGGWRWPSAFALVTLTVGGVNATSLLLVMAGPLLWFVHAVFVSKEVTFGRAMATGLRITVLTGITSLWWIAGLAVQGAYGIPILRYTETYHTVANAALSTELIRGLGYWFFYGRDALGAWITPAQRLVQSIPALLLSFVLPGLALAAGFLTRFRNRGFFALLVATGLVIGVGAHPWEASTPAGGLFQAWTRSDSGLAFRSTPRAVPLVALGLAVLLAAGVAAVAARWPAWRLPLSGALLVLVCLNQWALFAGEMVDRNLRRDEDLPSYWLDAAAAMDAGGGTGDADTRVYEMPGTDFASYRWGNTVDPITPGLIDRPYVARELIPYGTAGSADLLNAFDLPLQEGSFDPDSVAPIAQLMGVGTIVHRADLQYERFRTPRPRSVFNQLDNANGITREASFGVGVVNDPSPLLPLDDEVELGTPADRPEPPAVSLFSVDDPRPITRTVSASSPTVMAGDGAGIVSWAGAGAVDPDRPVFLSASFADDTDELDALVSEPESQLVVTDTNRRQARRWGSVRENDGYTERAGEEPLAPDPADNRLEKFPEADDDAFTVTEQVGGAVVAASAYGNPVSYTPADRAARAMDGDPTTAWRVGAFDEPRGEFLEISADEPVEPDSINLMQTQRDTNRWITEVELTFDDGDPVTVGLDDSSRSASGQEIPVGRRFSTLRITITESNIGLLDRYTGYSDVGFAEVTIPGVEPVTEVVRPPTDLLDVVGESSIDRDLSYVFERRRANPAEVVVDDEEDRLLRYVEGPLDRTFAVYGKATMSTVLDDAATDELLGVPGADTGGLDVTSSGHLAGDLRSRATSAVDGNPSTAWQTSVNGTVGQWMEVTAPQPVTVDHLDLEVVRDGLHSIPTRLGISVDGADPVQVDVPAVGIGERVDRSGADVDTEAGRTKIEVPVPTMTGSSVRVTIEAIEEAGSLDWFSGDRTVLPVGVAELGLGPTVAVPDDQQSLGEQCRAGLLSLDGTDAPVSLVGTVGDALYGRLVEFAGCDLLDVPGGRSLLESTPGAVGGFDIDQVVLSSAAGGSAGRDTLVDGPEPVAAPPNSAVTHPSRLGWDVEVTGAADPYWVVLGQSQSAGFTATATDGTDLGESTMVNGYANAWLVDPGEVGADTTITIAWTPQRLVTLGLLLSAAGVLVCLLLLVWPLRLWAGAALTDRPRRMVPRVVRPLSSEGLSVAMPRALAVAVGIGVLTWMLAGWAVTLLVAPLTFAALATRWGRPLLRIVGIGAFVVAAAYVVLKQWRNGYIVDFNWMNLFEFTHAWTLAAVALLVIDPVVGHLRRRPGQDPTR